MAVTGAGLAGVLVSGLQCTGQLPPQKSRLSGQIINSAGLRNLGVACFLFFCHIVRLVGTEIPDQGWNPEGPTLKARTCNH